MSENHYGKITLYATSEIGYKNLTKLSSNSYLNNKDSNYPYIEIDNLIKHNEDLILLTGNYNNFFGKLFFSNKINLFEKIIKKLKLSFGDRLYLEIQRHGENPEIAFENYLLKISSSADIPIIAGQSLLSRAKYGRSTWCINMYRRKKFVDDKNRFRYSNQHFFKKKQWS